MQLVFLFFCQFYPEPLIRHLFTLLSFLTLQFVLLVFSKFQTQIIEPVIKLIYRGISQFLTIAKQTVEDSELSNGIKICKKVWKTDDNFIKQRQYDMPIS